MIGDKKTDLLAAKKKQIYISNMIEIIFMNN